MNTIEILKNKSNEIFSLVAPIIEPDDKLYLEFIRDSNQSNYAYTYLGNRTIYINLTSLANTCDDEGYTNDSMIITLLYIICHEINHTMQYGIYDDRRDTIEDEADYEAYRFILNNKDFLERKLNFNCSEEALSTISDNPVEMMYIKDNLEKFYIYNQFIYFRKNEISVDLISELLDCNNISILFNNRNYILCKDGDTNENFKEISELFIKLNQLYANNRIVKLKLEIDKEKSNAILLYDIV